jgi:L-ascorbate metabolism protein UlaG (beta-lactamase superfamily)
MAKLGQNEVEVRWFGHACFSISTDRVTIVTDPFDQSVGYRLPELSADVLLISHDHFDHAYTRSVRAKQTYKGNILAGGKALTGATIKSIPSWHDTSEGRQRGPNTIWRIDIDGTIFAHLGDLGHLLDRIQLDALGKVNVLFIPVGGVYTIDAQTATRLLDLIKPNIAIPMHYSPAEARISLGLASVEGFLRDKRDVFRAKDNSTIIRRDDLPAPTKIIVLKYT